MIDVFWGNVLNKYYQLPERLMRNITVYEAGFKDAPGQLAGLPFQYRPEPSGDRG